MEFIPKHLLLMFVVAQVMGSVVEGSAVFKLLLVKYDNRNEKDWAGSCCDQWCAGGCDHKFTFCFDEYNGNDNFRSCEHGRWTSREINNANVNTFRNSIGGVPNPITKYFTSWPGGLKFKTEVYDDDDFNSSDLVDRLFKLINITPAKGAATSTWHTTDIVGTRSQRKTTLSIKYMAYCDKNYFGAKCDVHCKAMDSTEGHFRCDPDTGAKVCLSGWEDPKKSCTILKDNCAAVQCLNGGTCIDLYNSYTCTCPSGFEGDHCELNLDDCASQPCQNGATCVDGEDSYICQCSPGYVGINCESHVCATPSDVCLNGGTCYGTGQCFCPPGFVGSTCDIHRCNVTVCLNGGTCNDDGTCTCPPAYLGALCGVNMNAWLEHACGTLVHCDNGGTCHIGKCYCSEDYTGKYCSSRIDDCVGNPCLNEGVCEDGVSSYTCRCQADYNGTHCEEELGPPVWEEQILKNVTDEVFDVPTMKEPMEKWVIGIIVLLLILVAIVASLLYIYRRKFKRAKKAAAGTVGTGNFDNPTYGGRNNPAFFSVDTSTVSLASSPSILTDSVYAASEQQGGAQSSTDDHVYDNPEMLKKQINSSSSDNSDLTSPPLPPERSLSTASDPFSEYAVPLSPARPVLPDLVEGQPEVSPTITKTWPPQDDQAEDLSPKTPL